MSELISPGAQSIVKLKENKRKQWEVTYKNEVLYTSASREDASNARFRIIRAMNSHAQECEVVAGERGKAEERARCVGMLEAEDKAHDSLVTATVFAFHIKQGFGSGLRRAIAIINQE